MDIKMICKKGILIPVKTVTFSKEGIRVECDPLVCADNPMLPKGCQPRRDGTMIIRLYD